MATIKWGGATSTDSSVASNWQGGAKPGTTDDVVFDSTASDGCTLQEDLSVKSITMNSNWDETLDANGYDMIANDGAITLDGDGLTTNLNFSSSGSTVQVLGDYDFTTGADLDVNNEEDNCTVDLQGTGSFINNSSDFEPYALKCCYSGKTTTLASGEDIDVDSFYSAGGDLVLNNNLEIDLRTGDSFDWDVGELSGSGDITFFYQQDVDQGFSNGFYGPSYTGEIEFHNLSSGNRFNIGTVNIGGDIKFNSQSSTLVLDGSDIECNDFILQAGQFDKIVFRFSSNSYVINGNFYIENDLGNYDLIWGSSTWDFYGGVSFDPGDGAYVGWQRDTSTWYFKGNDNQTFIPETNRTCPDLIVDKAGGTLEIDNTFTCDRFQNDSDTVEIKAGEKITVSSYQSGDINGSTWRSDTGGTQAEVDFGSSVTVLNTKWTDINNVNATAIDATDSSNIDGGNNTNIDLPSVIAIAPDGIPSEEDFGDFTVDPGSATVSPAPIASSEIFGVIAISTTIVLIPSGILSGEAFGDLVVSTGVRILALEGIPSAEIFGDPLLTTAYAITPSSIPSSEAFEAPTVINRQLVTVLGVLSVEVFGDFTIESVNTIIPSGISSSEAFGDFTTSPGAAVVAPVGISSGEVFGVFVLAQEQFAIPAAIASEEAFGVFIASTGGAIVSLTGISSGEGFGPFTVSAGGVTVGIDGISSSEAFGDFTTSPGAAVVAPVGISSGEVFGQFLIFAGIAFIAPQGIASTEVFGTIVVSTGEVLVSFNSIGSEEQFGGFTLTIGPTTVIPEGVPSEEVFGQFYISFGLLVAPTGIVSGETFGSFTVINRQVLYLASMSSAEAFGAFIVSFASTPGFFSQFEQDISEVFLSESDFAESVSVHYKEEGISDNISAIFDREFADVETLSEYSVQSREPMAIIQTRKLRRKLKRGDWLEIRGIQFNVLTSEPDGTGVSEITLHHRT